MKEIAASQQIQRIELAEHVSTRQLTAMSSSLGRLSLSASSPMSLRSEAPRMKSNLAICKSAVRIEWSALRTEMVCPSSATQSETTRTPKGTKDEDEDGDDEPEANVAGQPLLLLLHILTAIVL